ncbi:hypothetical protein P7C70_g302, partial [Phenoliferia sp. Uapishka_3]
MSPSARPPAGPLGATDPTRWRLDSQDGGRHVWHYIRDEDSQDATAYEKLWGDDPRQVKKGEQTMEAKHALGLPLPVVSGLSDPAGDPWKAAKKGFEFYKRLQSPDGHWSGEYGGPLFLQGGLFIALYVTKTPIPEEWKIETARYLANIQRRGGESDDGWGICRWMVEGPDSEAFKQHVAHVRDFMWMSKDGMMACGKRSRSRFDFDLSEYLVSFSQEQMVPSILPRGSQLWDAAFISQALAETGLGREPENVKSATHVLEWLDECQIREDPKWYKEAYRHSTKGAWPFSTKEQGYTVSDCTAEGLKAVMMLQSLPDVPELVSKERMCDSIDLLLTMQNSSGGFASYELIRGPAFLELLNPAEVFGNIMIEYAYPECTTACEALPVLRTLGCELTSSAGVTAMSVFKKKYPDYRSEDIARVSKAAINYIRKAQRPDGSWYGSWGVCFTYATMFAVESLSLEGETYENSASVQKACDFILEKQMEDGGWGESFKSCENHVYVHNLKSQVVNTSWAVLTLLQAKYPDPEPVRRGCKLIMSRQLRDGSWAQESIEGVFNHAVAISYWNFKHSWTIWALGKASRVLGKEGWSA